MDLEQFFEEKDLDYRLYEIDYQGETHFIDSEFIILLLIEHDIPEVKNTLAKIDFANGDIHIYLKHVAKAYLKAMYEHPVILERKENPSPHSSS